MNRVLRLLFLFLAFGAVAHAGRCVGADPCRQCKDCSQVCPMFADRRQAIGYGAWRGNDGSSTLEVHDAAGSVLRAISGQPLAALATKLEEEAHAFLAGLSKQAYPRSE